MIVNNGKPGARMWNHKAMTAHALELWLVLGEERVRRKKGGGWGGGGGGREVEASFNLLTYRSSALL